MSQNLNLSRNLTDFVHECFSLYLTSMSEYVQMKMIFCRVASVQMVVAALDALVRNLPSVEPEKLMLCIRSV